MVGLKPELQRLVSLDDATIKSTLHKMKLQPACVFFSSCTSALPFSPSRHIPHLQWIDATGTGVHWGPGGANDFPECQMRHLTDRRLRRSTPQRSIWASARFACNAGIMEASRRRKAWGAWGCMGVSGCLMKPDDDGVGTSFGRSPVCLLQHEDHDDVSWCSWTSC
jgi:hypothetical protein